MTLIISLFPLNALSEKWFTSKAWPKMAPAISGSVTDSDPHDEPLTHPKHRLQHLPTPECRDQQVQSCMESDLRHLVFSEGFSAIAETEFLFSIKDLAVTVWTFRSCGSSPLRFAARGGTVKALGTRVKGRARNYNLKKICPNGVCDQSDIHGGEACPASCQPWYHLHVPHPQH